MIDILQTNKKFNLLVESIPSNPTVRDAEFYIRHDGFILNADGYAHPEDQVVGQYLYMPDPEGEKEIFGKKYAKLRFLPKLHEPIPYFEMRQILRGIDPELDQWSINPLPFEYEQIESLDEFVGYIASERAFEAAVSGKLGNPTKILDDLASLEEVLEVNLGKLLLGLTGSIALGVIEDYHDLDIVFREDVKTNRRIADKMRELVISEPRRRLHEGGKSWLIRFFNRDGYSNGTLMCCFFGYKDPEDAPLKEFTLKQYEKRVQIQGCVSCADHALYTPSIVTLHDVKTLKIGNEEVRERLPDNLSLIIYHTASRGELNLGDIVWAHGSLVEVITPALNYPAMVVIEREGVRNETPPWENYYSRARFS